MTDKEKKLLEDLRKEIEANSDDFVYVAEEIVDQLKEMEEPFRFVEPLLRLMEDYPVFDFGTPGPLVHFMESFYRKGYEELLLQSVQRNPTMHTIWMIHRITNTPQCTDKDKYYDVIEELAKRDSLDPAVKDEMSSLFML